MFSFAHFRHSRFLKNLRSVRGFTLTEMGLVVVLAGIMLVPLYSLIFYVTQLRPADDRFESVQEALAEHLRVTGTLPCPAAPALNMDDGTQAAFQAGNCTAGGGVVVTGGVSIGAVPIDSLRAAVNCAPPLVAWTIDVRSALRKSVFNFREVLTGEKGARDGVGGAIASNRGEDTECLSRDYMLDDFGNKLIYAVTNTATVAGFDVFDPALGSIVVQDQNGNLATQSRQVYILVSVGADGKGAFQRDGTPTGIACPGGRDAENCDFANATFVAMPKNDQVGAAFFDDQVDFGIAGFLTEDSFWRWGGVAGTNRDMVFNDNARLILDSDAVPDPGDRVVVERGGVNVAADLVVQGAGRQIDVESNVLVGEDVTATGNVVSPKFCYDPPLTPDCM